MRKAQPKPKLPPAGGFEPNAFYERVLELRRTNPAAFASLAPGALKPSNFSRSMRRGDCSRASPTKEIRLFSCSPTGTDSVPARSAYSG